MFLVKKLISAWFLSPAGLGILAIIGLVACVWGRRRTGGFIVGLAAVLLITLSLPLTSNELMRRIEMAPSSSETLKDAQAIVILGGGIHRGAYEYGAADTLSSATLVRLRYGAWLANRRHLPVLVSGGSVLGGTAEARLMAGALKDEFGVPVRWVEASSRDTAENALLSSALLKREGISRIALVSHAYHLRRASELFAKEGMLVAAAPTFATMPVSGFEAWLPSAGSLDNSFLALHELVGRLLDAVR